MEDPHCTLRKAAQEHGISMKSVHRILKKNKFHPFKVTFVHELNKDDFDCRVEFYEDMMARIDNNPNFHFNIVFSDEATFELNGTSNRYNCRYWDNVNPH